jgi:hypothetical protein
LADQFGTATVDVTRPDRFCNPADKNGEGIGESTVHGMCYRISESGFTKRNVLVQNQFGDQTLRVIRPETLCLPAGKNGVTPATETDHFKCYKVRGKGFTERTVTAADQFESKTTRVIKPRLLCNPVDKNGGGILDETCHLVCYQIRDTPGQPPFSPQDVTVEDQFTTDEDELQTFTGDCRKVAHLCVPSFKTELP